jgi:hypothetical protein
MCTSVAIGFYIRNKEEFDSFKKNMLVLGSAENSIFTVYEKRPEMKEIKIE